MPAVVLIPGSWALSLVFCVDRDMPQTMNAPEIHSDL